MDPARSSRAVSDDDTVIWRYMDLARFVWTLSTGGLWFAKATTLRDDPWEAFGKVERLSGQFAGGRPLRPRSCRDVASPALVRRRLRRTASGAMLRQRRGLLRRRGPNPWSRNATIQGGNITRPRRPLL